MIDAHNTIFVDAEHLRIYEQSCDRMRERWGRELDSYHTAAAYLLGVDNAIRDHFRDVFDFEEDAIRPEALDAAWQTSTSKRTTRLLYNLWNGWTTDGETYTDENGDEQELPSSGYSVDSIFCGSLGRYYYEAVKMRFGWLWSD